MGRKQEEKEETLGKEASNRFLDPLLAASFSDVASHAERKMLIKEL